MRVEVKDSAFFGSTLLGYKDISIDECLK